MAVAARVGYPVLVRPSYVLGGRAMEIVYDDASLRSYFARAARVAPEHPVLIDSFLEDAFEADVDAIADGSRCVIGGVMQHIEDAGIHSGDSACVLPPYLITESQVEEMRRHTRAFAERLGVVGLLNVQYAIKHDVVYVLEVNPRGSRTVPFVSKTTGVQLASLAAADHGGTARSTSWVCTMTWSSRTWPSRRRSFPSASCTGVDLILGRRCAPPARSWASPTPSAWRSQRRRSRPTARCRSSGAIFVTVNDHDKANVAPIARRFHALGFRVLGTEGTARYLRRAGMPTERVHKVHEGRPNAIDLLLSGPGPAAHQHSARQAQPAGRLRHPPGRAAASGAVHDDPVGRLRGLRRDHRPQEPLGRGARTSGMARTGARNVARMDQLTGRDPAFVGELRTRLRGEVREAEPLARYSTYRIGGPATVVLPAGAEDVGMVLRLAHEAGVPWFAVGLGSNLLFPDEGLDAVVLRMGKGLDEHTAGRRPLDGGRGAAGPAGRAANGRGGVRGASYLRGGAGHRRRWRVHERRLPRRGVVGGRGAGAGRGRHGPGSGVGPARRAVHLPAERP